MQSLSPAPSSQFAFVTCQPGLEAWIKSSVAAALPWRLAFGRPGFLTFKTPDAVAGDVPRPSILARSYGCSLGRQGDAAAAVAAARGLAGAVGALHLHHWALGPDALDRQPFVAALQAESSLWDGGPLFAGAAVCDLFAVDEQTMWMGWHRHGDDHAPFAGGMLDVSIPEAAPSRAYGKMVEMLAYAGVTVQPGDGVLELGSAPGGASLALLERGARVVAVDPGAMAAGLGDAAALHGGAFVHLRKAVGQLQRRDVGLPIRWLVSDMNLAPPAVLAAVERLLPWCRGTLRGLTMNWKINDTAVAEGVPRWLERLRSLGFKRVLVAQLGFHRREVGVYAEA